MTIKNDTTALYEVHGITDNEKQRIMDFLQGAVYCWCKNRPDEWFAVRKLMGGENFYWQGTPLMPLYEKQVKKGKSGNDAMEAAAIDCGWLLKKVIAKDKREFETEVFEQTRQYRWLPNPTLEDS